MEEGGTELILKQLRFLTI